MPQKPNIIWIMTDEQRCDSLGCYANHALTPNLDRLAKDGAVFRSAVTPCPMCVPTRLSIMNGCDPIENGVLNNRTRLEHTKHLTDLFANAGYTTASFGKKHYQTKNSAFQIENAFFENEHVAYDHYEPPFDENEFNVLKYGRNMNWILAGVFPDYPYFTQEHTSFEMARAFLKERTDENPFFLRISLNGPHTPVTAPPPFDKLNGDEIAGTCFADAANDEIPTWTKDLIERYSGSFILSDEKLKQARRCYYNYVSYLDFEIGNFLGWAKENGFLDNTIVAYVSDHGTHLGDHGLVQKQTFFNEVVKVPFIFWWPNHIPAGQQIHSTVSTQALLPTLLDLVGLPVPQNKVSYADCLRSAEEPPETVVHSTFIINPLNDYQDKVELMAELNGVKLVVQWSPEKQFEDYFLYVAATDPHEQKNQINDPQYADAVARLKESLNERVALLQACHPKWRSAPTL